MSNLYLALIHYPVYNREGELITSSITNLDIHDIARSCITFGVKNYIVVHPVERQKQIFEKILSFWKSDVAKFYNKDRVDALTSIQFAKDINETINMIKYQDGSDPIIVTTTATKLDEQISFEELKFIRKDSDRPVLLVFGTGNGLSSEIHQIADYILRPICGPTSYNHLSVRSAVAIVLDRLTTE